MDIKNRQSVWFLLTILASCLLLFACDKNEHYQKLQNDIDQLKHSVAKNKIKNNQVSIQFPEPAIYKGDTLRAPFEDAQGFGGKGIQINPLLTYPLIMLRLLGTVTQDDVCFAYILAPDNKTYQVKIGNNIGDHNGKISHIYPDRIEIMEQDSEDGSVSKHLDVMKLKEEH